MDFKIGQLQDLAHAISNKVYLSNPDYAYMLGLNNQKEPVYVTIKESVYILGPAKYMEKGSAGLSKKQREFLKLSQSLDTVRLSIFQKELTTIVLGVMGFAGFCEGGDQGGCGEGSHLRVIFLGVAFNS